MSPGGKIQAICVTAGIICGLGWWLFIDGASYAAQIHHPIQWYFTLPGILATFAAIIIIGVDWESLRGNAFGGAEVTQARAWFLFSIMVFTGSLILAMFILISFYTGEKNPGVDAWPGASIVMQTFLVYISAIVFASGRYAYSS